MEERDRRASTSAQEADLAAEDIDALCLQTVHVLKDLALMLGLNLSGAEGNVNGQFIQVFLLNVCP